MSETVNFGLVVGIWAGATAPANTNILWRDTSSSTHLTKIYNTTTSSWEELTYSTLVDNDSIKKDVDGKLYVDTSVLPELQVADGSITFAKIQDVPSGTLFYRKSSGSGSVEVQTLAQLKSDLGLSGTNTGDQDLSLFVVKSRTINDKPLTSNIVLTPEDIGSPTGSGTSIGSNTGDETNLTIKTKLGIEGNTLSGNNTGDETYERIITLFGITEAEGEENTHNIVSDEELDKLNSLEPIPTITLPSDTTVAGRISALTEGTDYPTGWSLSVGESEFDLLVTHNKGRKVFDVKVYSVDSLGKERMLIPFDNAYSGILTIDSNSVQIEALSEVQRQLKIYIEFV